MTRIKLIGNRRSPGLVIASLAVLAVFLLNSGFKKANPKVLVFCKTAAFKHASIKVGVVALQKLGAENKFDVDSTTDAKKFTAENLKQYKAVIFLSTTGDVLNDEQQTQFEQYIRSGGGYVGIHAATDCEYNWQWYGNLSGAYFRNHPRQQQNADLVVNDAKNSSTKHLPVRWNRKDEWYSYKWMATDLHVLLSIDEKTYDPQGSQMGEKHPLAWYHDYDGGHAFYTALGHTDESYADPLFLKHVLGGIKYAMTGKTK